jgi:hypothetical protein
LNEQEVVKLLNGRDCENLITDSEIEILKNNNLVIVYGENDNLIKFKGVFNDEQEYYNIFQKQYITVNPKGIYKGICSHKDCEHYEFFSNFYCENCEFAGDDSKNFVITVLYGATYFAWLILTHIQHSSFDILKNDKKFCKGIVFNLDNIENRSKI